MTKTTAGQQIRCPTCGKTGEVVFANEWGFMWVRHYPNKGFVIWTECPVFGDMFDQGCLDRLAESVRPRRERKEE